MSYPAAVMTLLSSGTFSTHPFCRICRIPRQWWLWCCLVHTLPTYLFCRKYRTRPQWWPWCRVVHSPLIFPLEYVVPRGSDDLDDVWYTFPLPFLWNMSYPAAVMTLMSSDTLSTYLFCRICRTPRQWWPWCRLIHSPLTFSVEYVVPRGSDDFDVVWYTLHLPFL